MIEKEIVFSVIIPIYNVGNALSKCLNTLAVQPYDDFEILLINDGSTDKITLKIINEYTEQFEFIYRINKKNGGCVDARRTGIKNAKGTYIVFADGDDFFDKNYMEILHQAIQNKADFYILNNYLNHVGTCNFYIEKKQLITGYVSLEWVYEQMFNMKIGAVWDKIYVRKLFGKECSIIPENINYGEDIYINNRYIHAVNRVFVLNKAVYYHICDSLTSVCTNNITAKRLYEINVVFNSGIELCERNTEARKWLEKFKDAQYRNYIRTISLLLHSKATKDNIEESIVDLAIDKNVYISKAASIKGAVYRILTKYRFYSIAKMLFWGK